MPPLHLAGRDADAGVRRHRGLLPVAALVSGLLAAGCSGAQSADDSAASAKGRTAPSASSSSAAQTPPAQACKKLPAATIPGAAGAVSQEDSGTFCLAAGATLDVFLTSPSAPKPGGKRWDPVATSDAHILVRRSSGILTPPVGVTPGIFQAQAPGSVELSSSLPDSGRTWHVTIVVR